MHISLVTLLVEDYDSAVDFFTGVLGFELCEDSEALSEDGYPKRWVVVRPPRAETGLLLARAAGRHQRARIGDQAAGRVGFFLHVEDVDAMVAHLRTNGVQIVREPRDEAYGRVAVFCDIAGNHWDLLGPESQSAATERSSPGSSPSRSTGCTDTDGGAGEHVGVDGGG